MTRVAAVLLVVYAGMLLGRAAQIWGVSPAPRLMAVGAVALPLAIGLWKGARWAWWGTLMILLFMLGWLALGAFVLLVTPEGRSALLNLLTTPSPALASITLEFLILILLLVPSSRAAVRRRAGALLTTAVMLAGCHASRSNPVTAPEGAGSRYLFVWELG